MTTDRRLHDMDLGRREHTRWLGVHRVSSRLTLPTTGLLAAYDARAGVTDVSGACSAWADQSGNGWHASQGTAGNRPTITTDGGYASLLFDGTSDNLIVPSITSSASAKCVYAVFRRTGVASSHRALFDAQGTGTRLFAGQITTSNWGLLDTVDRDSGIAPDTTMHRGAFECQSGASRVYIGGVAGAATGWTANTAIGGTVRIGSDFAGTGRFLGHIFFLAVYNAARNTAVEDYITQEWGV